MVATLPPNAPASTSPVEVPDVVTGGGGDGGDGGDGHGGAGGIGGGLGGGDVGGEGGGSEGGGNEGGGDEGGGGGGKGGGKYSQPGTMARERQMTPGSGWVLVIGSLCSSQRRVACATVARLRDLQGSGVHATGGMHAKRRVGPARRARHTPRT